MLTANVGRTEKGPVLFAKMKSLRNMRNLAHHIPKIGGMLAVLCFQEVNEGDRFNEMANVYKAFRERDGWLVIPNGKEPVVVHVGKGNTHGWTVVHHTRILTMEGVPHQSPARYASLIVLKNAHGHTLAFVCGHYPAGAYNGQRDAGVKRLLVEGWDAHQEHVLALTTESVEKAMIDTFAVTDNNRPVAPSMFPALPHARHERVAQRIDVIEVGVPVGRRVTLVKRGEIAMDIDMHNCQYGVFEMKNAS